MKRARGPTLPLLLVVAISLVCGVASFRVSLDAPKYVLRGRSAKLVCNHGVERRLLHKVEWLRDGERKLFQFVRGRNPPYRNFTIPGAMLDWAQSNERHITLRKLDLEACGVYSCEVSMETPIYTKPSNEILMTVIQPQNADPEIWGRKSSYLVGERLEVNCTSAPSHPPAHVTWLVNGRQVSDQFLKIYHSHKSHPYHRHHNHHHHHHRFHFEDDELREEPEMNEESDDLMLDPDLIEPVAHPSVVLVPTSTTIGISLPIAMHHARLGLGVGGRLRLTCQSTLPSIKGPHPNEIEFSDKRSTSISVDILMPMQEEEDDDDDYLPSSSNLHVEPTQVMVLLPISLVILTLLLLPMNKTNLLSTRHDLNLCHSQPRR